MIPAPLRYPIGVTCGTLVISLAWVPFASIDQLAVLAVATLFVGGFTVFQLVRSLGVGIRAWPSTDDATSAGRARMPTSRTPTSGMADGTDGRSGHPDELADGRAAPARRRGDARSSRSKEPLTGRENPDAGRNSRPSKPNSVHSNPTIAFGSRHERPSGGRDSQPDEAVSGHAAPGSGRGDSVVGRGGRVRQQYRLESRSWVEIRDGSACSWVPVFYSAALATSVAADVTRDGRRLSLGAVPLYPSGPVRSREPVGKLTDNPSRPRKFVRAHWYRRLLLDAQGTVAAPLIALMWVYVTSASWAAFLPATLVAAAVVTWWAAIRGSDPS
ncbi:hypothetical protein [Nocardia camponoti]|uniref:Uncharacterized protein n=1 Tax=Nocardia camponoti TaxID=1616106 RepID=A0A917VAC9_9NOCA|nr:hypothetical protein [Nocardia camponoti]GGK55411.1 hypothetical protein GCM10011591_29220 [Nocardia camponoti]